MLSVEFGEGQKIKDLGVLLKSQIIQRSPSPQAVVLTLHREVLTVLFPVHKAPLRQCGQRPQTVNCSEERCDIRAGFKLWLIWN